MECCNTAAYRFIRLSMVDEHLVWEFACDHAVHPARTFSVMRMEARHEGVLAARTVRSGNGVGGSDMI